MPRGRRRAAEDDDFSGKPNPIDVHVGSRVRLRRTLLGMSQEKLGEAIGLTFQQVQKYERGANRIGSSRLFDLARVLDVPVAYFFEEMTPETAARTPSRIKGLGESRTGPRLLPDRRPIGPQASLRTDQVAGQRHRARLIYRGAVKPKKLDGRGRSLQQASFSGQGSYPCALPDRLDESAVPDRGSHEHVRTSLPLHLGIRR
jgi:transcriptional regulator with XRE-family HTH domain